VHSTLIAVDVARSVFEVAMSSAPGRVRDRRRLSRTGLQALLASQAPARVVMEACGSARYWGREGARHGHEVTLLHPGDVARYRDGNKTDRADTKALLEACRHEALDPVPVKSVEHQALAALHRIRQGYLRTRTARINGVRGHLREFGVTIPVGARAVGPRAREALAAAAASIGGVILRLPRWVSATMVVPTGRCRQKTVVALRKKVFPWLDRSPNSAVPRSNASWRVPNGGR
jgi:transposase